MCFCTRLAALNSGVTAKILWATIAPFRKRRGSIINSTTRQLERSQATPERAQAGTCRAFIIHNPISGRRGGRLRKVLAHLEQMGCQFVVHHTSRRGHARELVAQASQSEYDRLVVSGGDGTINEVVNSLSPDSPPVAIIPRGTANVLAAEIGLGLDAREIAETIVRGEARRVSVGAINGHKFLLMAGVGFDAQVVATVSSRLKRAIGKGAYVLASLQQMIRGDFPRFKVLIDGIPHEAASVVIANAHYYGGRFVCAPEARLDSPDLQVCLFGHGSRFFVAVYGLALMLRLLPWAPGYRILPATRIEILQPDGAEFQCDGDFIGHTPAVATVTPEAARLVFPRRHA